MSKKVYDADEIMKMAVGLVSPDIKNADYDGNGLITAADARARNRIGSGLSSDTAVGNTGVSSDRFSVSNAYQNQADAIYKQIQDTPDFKYDFNEDAVFRALRDQYMKDGKLAAENVQGQAAALSGGFGNSYGATAAGQAYMGAVDDLYALVPDFEDRAYSRYQDERNKAMQEWEVMQSRADAERGYAENERAYEDSRESLEFDRALSLASIGDYSGLEALGIDPSYIKKQSDLDFALAAAQYGDYSFLKAMGIDTSAVETPSYRYSGGYSGGYSGDDFSEALESGSGLNSEALESDVGPKWGSAVMDSAALMAVENAVENAKYAFDPASRHDYDIYERALEARKEAVYSEYEPEWVAEYISEYEKNFERVIDNIPEVYDSNSMGEEVDAAVKRYRLNREGAVVYLNLLAAETTNPGKYGDIIKAFEYGYAPEKYRAE